MRIKAYKALVRRQEHRDAGVDLADCQGHEHRCWVPGCTAQKCVAIRSSIELLVEPSGLYSSYLGRLFAFSRVESLCGVVRVGVAVLVNMERSWAAAWPARRSWGEAQRVDRCRGLMCKLQYQFTLLDNNSIIAIIYYNRLVIPSTVFLAYKYFLIWPIVPSSLYNARPCLLLIMRHVTHDADELLHDG